MSQHRSSNSGGCRRCPFGTPFGQCLAPGLKSGRCGDWVWYLRGTRQWRRLYVKPKDPCTPTQRRCRARFGAASMKYSRSLNDAQRHACALTGAKLHSRPRLGQSGPLTGQQYAIRQELAATPPTSTPSSAKSGKALQTKGISLSTSGQHRRLTGGTPHPHLRHQQREVTTRCRAKTESTGMRPARNLFKIPKFPTLARPAGSRCQAPPRPARQPFTRGPFRAPLRRWWTPEAVRRSWSRCPG